MAITSKRAVSAGAILTGLGGGNASGTNAVAVGATLTNSLSTGNATNPNLVFQVGVKTASGAAQATATPALTLVGETLAATFAGAVAAPSLALGGAAIGSNALAVAGTVNISGGAVFQSFIQAGSVTATAGNYFIGGSSYRIADGGVTGKMILTNFATTTGVLLDIATDGMLKVFARDGTTPASLTVGALTTSAAVGDSGYNYQTPSTGFTITMANGNYHLILDPAGTLATGTITMCAAPVDGQIVDIKISQIITALTVAGNSGQSVKGNPTSAAVGSSFTGIYRAANTTWYF